jgi:hypothetical protein
LFFNGLYYPGATPGAAGTRTTDQP